MSTSQTNLRFLWQSRASGGRAAVLFMAGFGLCWAIAEDVFGTHLQHSYGLIQIVWMRYAVHLVIVFLLWGWHEPSRIWRTERPVFHLARSLMMLVMPLSFAWAFVRGVPAALTSALFWIAPVLVILLAIVWRQERPSRLTWVAIALGTLGTFAIVSQSLPTLPAIPIAPLVMALSFSVYVVMTRFLRTERVEANLFYTAVGVFAILSLIVPKGWITPSVHDIEMIVGIGTFGFVSLLMLDRAVSHAPVCTTSPALYSQLAFAALIGIFASGHRPSLHTLAGLVLIVGAAALAWALPEAKDLKSA